MFSSPLFLAFRQMRSFVIAFFFAISLFLIQYYLMATLPGEENLSCVMGAWLTFGNIVFSLFVSLLFGFLVAVFIYVFSQSLKSVASTSGVFSVLGFGTSMLTVFCTFCTLPVISLFGFSIGLGIFTFYNAYFKVLSIIFLFISIFLLHQKLQKGCKVRKLKKS